MIILGVNIESKTKMSFTGKSFLSKTPVKYTLGNRSYKKPNNRFFRYQRIMYFYANLPENIVNSITEIVTPI